MSKSDCFFQLSFPSPLLLFPLRLLSPPSPSPEGAVIALVTSGYTEWGWSLMNWQCVTGGQLELLQKYGVFVCPCAPSLLERLGACTLMSWLCFAFLFVFVYFYVLRWWGEAEFVLCLFIFQALLQSLCMQGFFGRGEQEKMRAPCTLRVHRQWESAESPFTKKLLFLRLPVASIVLSITEIPGPVKRVYSCFLASLSHTHLQENSENLGWSLWLWLRRMEGNFKLNLRVVFYISAITLGAQCSAKGSPQLPVPLKTG